ncbi:hypothetical protein CMALT394_20107 [Carnobacterium maltaromaticum]|nr:hypothetical protein CMALT394_20107 [Carnobacterium maltaromaticum]
MVLFLNYFILKHSLMKQRWLEKRLSGAFKEAFENEKNCRYWWLWSCWWTG